VPTFLQNIDHIKRRTTTDTQQNHLHWPNTNVATTMIWRAVHNDSMAAAGFADKHSAIDPFNRCLHVDFQTKKMSQILQRYSQSHLFFYVIALSLQNLAPKIS
jgi:hypothetical protein